VPGDISSAAFIIVATLICSKSSVKINNVGINSLRDGIIRTLIEMGGDIKLTNKRKQSGEDVCDILVKSSKLKGIEIPSSRAPSMIDEYPILSIAAANAEGLTIMKGIEELKVKESNRLFAINEGLNKCGVKTKMGDDYLEISGGITQPNDIVKIKSYMDHRIAMSFLIMGLKIVKGIEIDDVSMINTSFPNFNKTLKKLGINI
jgi:3-phosphoshikimate 1-carboxyvinyltransferase